MDAHRYFRIETDLTPDHAGKCALIQTDGDEHWTLATFHGREGFEAATLIAQLLAQHALPGEPAKWATPK